MATNRRIFTTPDGATLFEIPQVLKSQTADLLVPQFDGATTGEWQCKSASQILDQLSGSATAQGNMLTRGASLWQQTAGGTATGQIGVWSAVAHAISWLGQGASGQVLATGGIGVNPSWRAQKRIEYHEYTVSNSNTPVGGFVAWSFTPGLIIAFARNTTGGSTFSIGVQTGNWQGGLAFAGGSLATNNGYAFGDNNGVQNAWQLGAFNASQTMTKLNLQTDTWDFVLIAFE